MTLADTLQLEALEGVMLDRKAQTEEKLRHRADSISQAKGGPTMVSPVIALHDLRTGSDAEINRLEDREASLTAEIGNLRQENQKLILDNQNLRSELLEIKLVLSRVQIDELRGLEKVNSWLRSFKMLL